MAKRIMKDESEEYDAKEPAIAERDQAAGGDLKSQAKEWKSKLEAVADPKLLGYIQDCVSCKLQEIKADERLEGEGEENPKMDY